ncbi:2184_t:CDS:1, partial [Gigaspora rosea]
DVAMYLDSVSTSKSSIDTLADMGVTMTFCTVSWHKTTISEEYVSTVDSALAKYIENAM